MSHQEPNQQLITTRRNLKMKKKRREELTIQYVFILYEDVKLNYEGNLSARLIYQFLINITLGGFIGKFNINCLDT